MSYTDRDMLVATQIAYYDFDTSILEANGYNATLRELLEQDPGVYERLQSKLENAGGEAEVYRYTKAMELYHEIMSEDSKYGDWKLKAVKDDNATSGFYGCLIETEDDTAVVGFRGSESMNGHQLYRDWALADFGMVNNDLTRQQWIAEQFMKEINDRYHYDKYYTSGHSLGGNLSNHAVITADKDMQEKIVQAYSFDGPGFSQAYLKEHESQIRDSDGKLTHYKWSLISECLTQPDTVREKVVDVKDTTANDVWDFCFQRHDTCFVEFDEHGSVVQGDGDLLRKATYALAWVFDQGVYALTHEDPIEQSIERFHHNIHDVRTRWIEDLYRKLDEKWDGNPVNEETFHRMMTALDQPYSLACIFSGPAFSAKKWIEDGYSVLHQFEKAMHDATWEKETAPMTGGDQIPRGGKFSVNPMPVRSAISAIESVPGRMESLAGEIDRIQKALDVGGPAVNLLVRGALRRDMGNVRKLAKRVKKLNSAGTEIMECYQNTEDRVAEAAGTQ